MDYILGMKKKKKEFKFPALTLAPLSLGGCLSSPTSASYQMMSIGTKEKNRIITPEKKKNIV